MPEKMKSIRTKMLAGFLAISLIPMILMVIIAMVISGNAMSSQVFGQLENIREVKKKQVTQYFEERMNDLDVLIDTVGSLRQAAFDKLRTVQENKKAHIHGYFQQIFSNIDVISKSVMVHSAMRDFETVIDSEGNFDTRLFDFFEEVKYGQSLRKFKQVYEYYDLLLITRKGDIVYSTLREPDLGRNVVKGDLKHSGLGRCFEKGLNKSVIEDFSIYQPSGNRRIAFACNPIRAGQGDVIGVVALKLTSEAMEKIVQRREGMGLSGESFIVGINDNRVTYRTERIVGTSSAGDLADQENFALALERPVGPVINIGNTGTAEIITYDPLEIPGLDWVIITSMNLDEVIDPRLQERQKDYFFKYIKSYGYTNLFLISPRGLVFYSATRGAEHLTNVLDENPVNEGLFLLFREVSKNQSAGFVDFDLFGPDRQRPMAYIGQPLIIDDRVEMVVALEFPLERLNEIMRGGDGMATTAETYLIGSDALMRSDSQLQPQKYNVINSFRNPERGRVVTAPVIRALAGESGKMIARDYREVSVFSAYCPIYILDTHWALLAEIDEEKAYSSLNLFLFLALTGSIAVMCVMIAFSLMVSRRLTLPIGQLTEAARQVKSRNFDISVDVKSNDEIQLLGEAFNAMVVRIREYSDSLIQKVDQLRSTQEKLRKSEEKFRSIVESSSDFIWEIDNHARFTYASPKVKDILGYDSHEIIGKMPFEFMVPEAKDNSAEKLPEKIENRTPFESVVSTYRHKDGRKVVLESSAVPIIGSNGDFLGFRGIDRNITQRMEAEKALARSEERLRNVYETAPLAFVVWDSEYRILQWNRQAEKMFGWSDGEAVGEHFFELIIPNNERETALEIGENLLKSEDIQTSMVNRNATKNGEIIWCEWNHSVLHDSQDNIVAAISLGLDITDRIRNERELRRYREHLEELVKERTAALEAKNKELETFTYSVSHDLKAPLRGIDGYSRLLMEDYMDDLDEDGKQFVKNVRESAKQMNQLIEDLLTYSRVERRDIFPVPTDIPEMVNTLLREREHDLAVRNIDVNIDLPFGQIHCDRDSMRQILGNLIDNAIKFSREDGDAVMEIKGREKRDQWILWIKDNGVGFDSKFQERIFGIFQRLHRVEDYPGTGVGLAIVQKAITRMGGTVRAESQLGKGATFYLEIPKVQAANGNHDSNHRAEQVAPKAGS